MPLSCGITGIVGRRRPASSPSCRTRSSSPKCPRWRRHDRGRESLRLQSGRPLRARRLGRRGQFRGEHRRRHGDRPATRTRGRPVPPRPPHLHLDQRGRTQTAPVLRLQLLERAARGRSRYDFRRRQRVQLERLTVSLKTPAVPSSPWVERSEIESFVRHSERTRRNGHRLRRLARSEKDGRSTFPATATEA